MKKKVKRDGFFKLKAKHTLWSSTFQIINFQSLTIYEIQYWSQILFSLFFGYWFEREEREWLDFSDREIKSRLKLILAIKTSGFDVNGFLLMGKVYTRCFSLNLVWNGKSESEKNFYFGLIVGFITNF